MTPHAQPTPQRNVGPLQWAVGAYCLLLGAVVLVAPHLVGAFLNASLAQFRGMEGILILGAGFALLVTAVHTPRPALFWAVHVYAGTILCLRAAETYFAFGGFYTGTSTHLLLGAGVALAPLAYRLARGDEARSRSWFSLVVSAILVAGSFVMLRPPAGVQGLLAGSRPFLPWFSAGLLIAGLWLAAAEVRGAAHQAFHSAAHLFAGAIMVALPLPNLQLKAWLGVMLYFVLGLAVALEPWLAPRLARVDPASLRLRLTVTLAALGTVPLIAIAGLLAFPLEQRAVEQAFAMQESIALAISHDVEDFISLHQSAAVSLAQEPGLLRLPLREQRAMLDRANLAFPQVLAFSLVDAAGRNLAKARGLPLLSYADNPQFLAVRRTNQAQVTVLKGILIPGSFVVIGAPVRDGEGRFDGMVQAGFNTTRIANLMSRTAGRIGGETYILDGERRIVAHPDASRVFSPAPMAALPPLNGSLRYNGPTGEHLASTAQIPQLGWTVVVDRPVAVALADLSAQRNLTLAGLLAGTLAACFIGAVMARKLTSPLDALASATTRLADGDVSAPTAPAGVTEIDQLRLAFENLRRRLAERTGQRDRAEAELQQFNRDLEARVQRRTAALAAATARNHLLGDLLERADQPFGTGHMDGTLGLVNAAFERLTGYRWDDLQGINWAEKLTPPEWREVEWAKLQELHRTGSPVRYEKEYLRKDGTRVPIELLVHLGKDEQGQPLYYSFVTDLTGRKQAERELRQSEERYRTLFETLIEGFCIIEVIFDAEVRAIDYRFEEINPAFERQTGLKNAKGRLMSELAPEQEAHWYEIYGQVALTGQPARFVNEAKTLNRWFDVIAYRVGRPESRRVAILFNDITEPRKAEEARRQSEERFRALVTASSDVIYRMSPDWSEMYHLRGRDFIADTDAPSGAWIQKYIHPDDQPHVMAAIHEAIRTRSMFELEHRVLRVDGSLGWTFSRAIPMQDANGEIVEWFGAASDVTERKQAEAALRESEAQFRALANEIPQLCWTANADGWIFWYNQRWYEYTGTTPEQMEGWGWQSVHDPEALPEVLERWQATIATGEPFDMVFPLRGADGVFRPFLTRIMPVRDHDGKVTRWFGTNTDISEQRKTEEALASNASRLREYLASIVDSTDDAIIIEDQEGTVLSWNHGAERIFGYSAGETTGRNLSILVPPECMDEASAILESIARGEPVKSFETERIRKDGQRIYVSLTVSPVRDAAGRIEGGCAIERDVTERKRAEEQIRRFNTELEQRVAERTAGLEAANRELESFSYSVSHDLRAPLRHMDGFLGFLEKKIGPDADPATRHLIDVVVGASRTMGTLIDDLLAFSRMGRVEMRQTEVDLAALAERVAGDMKGETAGRAVEWRIGALGQVHGDPSMLRMVLQNLLANSVKFTRLRTLAVIEIGREPGGGGEAVFFVRDNGVGFDMRYVHKLFGVFQRLHTEQEFEGTGIGLANVHRIVRRHGGRVWAESALGQGATIYFSLPVSGEDLPAPVAEAVLRP